MRCCSPALSAVVLALAVTPRSAAQQPLAGARIEAVQLDVIVTDASGKPVTALTKDDFGILEDKKQQKLTTFVFVEGRLPKPAAATVPATPAPGSAAAPATASAPASSTSAEVNASSPTPGRHLVIVIDDLHIAPGNVEFVKGALRRLVDD